MIEIENLEEFAAGLEAFVLDVYVDWSQIVRKLVGLVFTDIVSTSPQWSGNFAANWNVSIGSPSSAYEDTRPADWRDPPGGPQFMGDTIAVQEAMARNHDALASITLTSDVYINNLTPYAVQWVDKPAEFLRPGNYINPTPIPIGHALDLFDQRFATVAR